ncbi:MAG: tRNA (adenosine(37)-N6)-threonylcarbamoyltransferase complex ATPase subunit type 1 TsaE [Burkholderiaceae bacterium]|nr:tRNA (adenosine(37)-N6)-threonylcarbamoyltransferase complex ATPase subunit type 1 TsaE [Burkholderiaceae bacterium]
MPQTQPLAAAHFELADEAATARLGALLAHALRKQRASIEANGFVIGLSGDLGAGKTALVRAMLRALGETGPVKSPTFALLEPYVVSSLNFYHFDFYRFADPEEFTAAGFRELFGPGAVCAIEWPERARGALPTLDLALTLKVKGDGRGVDAAAYSATGAACLNEIAAAWKTRSDAG